MQEREKRRRYIQRDREWGCVTRKREREKEITKKEIKAHSVKHATK
jgi:hypothetical protein